MKQNNVLAFLVDKISAEAQADKNFEKYAKDVLTEGYQTGLLSTRLNDTEYEFIQDKIMSYMVADQKLKNVKALTRLIPTIALLIGALCKQISKGKLIKILSASLIMEIVIDAVMKNVLKLDLEELDPDEFEIEDEEEDFFEEDLFDDDEEYQKYEKDFDTTFEEEDVTPAAATVAATENYPDPTGSPEETADEKEDLNEDSEE